MHVRPLEILAEREREEWANACRVGGERKREGGRKSKQGRLCTCSGVQKAAAALGKLEEAQGRIDTPRERDKAMLTNEKGRRKSSVC